MASSGRTPAAPLHGSSGATPSPAGAGDGGGGSAGADRDQGGDAAATDPGAAGSEVHRPLDLQRSAWWWVRLAAAIVAVFVGYQLVLVLGGLLSSVLTVVLCAVFGAVLALIAKPAVDAVTRLTRLPRTVAILVTLLVGLAILGLLGFILVGALVSEVRGLAAQLPDLFGRLNRTVNDLRSNLDAHGIQLGSLDVQSAGTTVASRLTGAIIGGITTAINLVIDTVVALVIAFWLLKDGAGLRRGLNSLLPARLRTQVDFGLDAVEMVIGGYVRAQLLLALIIGVLAGVGSAVIGVPYPLVVGVAAGVFELVPLVGPFLGGAVAVLLAFTVSPTLPLLAVALFLLIHVIEGYVLAPRIQARFVQLHPLVALLALFAGIEAAGFLGALFAVPVASLVAVFVRVTLGDVRAKRPDLFALEAADQAAERRRELLLGEFRLFHRPPVAMLRERLGRWRGRDGGPPAAGADAGGPDR